jgi:hypothetical protein
LIGDLAQKPVSDFIASPAFSILRIRAASGPHTDGIVNGKKKGASSNALTSLARQTDHPLNGRRRPGF